jgi:hypothetical protein
MRPRLLWLMISVVAVMPAFGSTYSLSPGDSAFGMLGGTIGDTGTSLVVGDVGAVTSITGFVGGPASATGFVCTEPGGTGGQTCTGQQALVTTAYNDFESDYATAVGLGTGPTTPLGTLAADTVLTGNTVYTAGTVSTTTGINLTFNAQNDPTEVFVILIDGALTVNGAMTFTLENGALASNIYWIVEDNTATISVGSAGPIDFDGNILAGGPLGAFEMSAATGGSGVLAGTINGCVFAETANTLAGETDVNGCFATGESVPEPGSAGLVSLGGLLGVLAWRKFRLVC